MTYDFTCFRSRLRMKGTLDLLTPLCIGSGGADNVSDADITVVKDANGEPYIPGSSLKGVLRSHTEGVLRTIDDSKERNLACLCVTERRGEADGCPTTRDGRKLSKRIEELEADIRNGNPTALDEFFLKKSCWVCRVFGSPWLASKVLIKDLVLADDWPGQYQIRNGVSIDRDTETAVEGRLYNFEVVPAGTLFCCEIIVDNASEAEQGMVLLGLKAFENGHLTVGGGSSRGLGRVKLIWDWEACAQVNQANGADTSALLDFLLDDRMARVDEKVVRTKIDAFREELGV